MIQYLKKTLYEIDKKKLLRQILWVVALFSVLFVLLVQDWHWQGISKAMRLKFNQIFNIVFLWLPILLFDAATEGRTLNIISMPEEPLDKMASALFYGCMAIATALCIVWGA